MKRAAQDRPGTNSSSGGRLDGDLRAVLRERPDSQVNEALFVPPCSSGRMVGVVPVDSPIVGHLAMARLAGGHVEMVNLGVMALQASMALCLSLDGGKECRCCCCFCAPALVMVSFVCDA